MSGWQTYAYLIISFTVSKHCCNICFLSSFCHFWTWITKISIQRSFLTCSFSNPGARYLVVLTLVTLVVTGLHQCQLWLGWKIFILSLWYEYNVWFSPGQGTDLLNTSDFLYYYWLFWCSYYSWVYSIGRVTLGPNGLKHLLLTAFFFGHMYFLVSLCFLINFI